MAILQQVLGLFLIMLCGLVAVKAKWIDDKGVKGLHSLVIYFSLPAQIFAKLQVKASADMALDLVIVFLVAGLTMLAFGGFAWLIFKKETPKRRSVLACLAMFSNAAYMGFPLLSVAFSEGEMIYGVMYVAMFNLLCWSVGVMIYDSGSINLKDLCTAPALIASVAGILCFVAGWLLPTFLVDTLNTLGNATTPLAMFIVGTHLSTFKAADLLDVKLLAVSAMRLLVFPLLVYGALTLAGTSQIVTATLTLLTAMPCAASAVILAERYGGDATMASKGVSISTALSVATIPLIMMLFA